MSIVMPISANNTSLTLDDLSSQTHFITWQGIEPDKWATLWLLKRHVTPDAYFSFSEPHAPLLKDGFAFGVPDAQLYRDRQTSMFHQLATLSKTSNNEQVLSYIDRIIHDVEVNIWDAPSHPHSAWFETLFRQLQARYQRTDVPIDCYLSFFDKVANLAMIDQVTAADYEQHLSLTDSCPGIVAKHTDRIQQVSQQEVLRAISLGKNVVFVDTREQEEYDEVHLPNAVLMRLRDVDEQSTRLFRDADLVVPYCIKDFRGFEVARALHQHGIKNVATLSPNGLKGWLVSELPVVTAEGMNEKHAQTALRQCATEPVQCLDKTP